MCGIAGIMSFEDQRVDPEVIARMAGMLRHRGPDGIGCYVGAGIGLGHARLSIIDLEGGAQPIHNENKSVWVVFNGEIFNYVELRSDLQAKGHVFYTQTDTEVIVHLYEEYGEEFVHHLNGQFAIALWDQVKRQLCLVRDRAGILPLFYHKSRDHVLFASEVKAILLAAGKPPRLNPRALDQLMTFWAPIGPETVFEDIFEILPGQMLTFRGGREFKRQYWEWAFPRNGEYRNGTEEELAEELHDLLVDATKLRLRSDVPVGAYLSGGLDSSTLVSIIHHHGQGSLCTFSIGFEDRALDEGEYQRELLKHLGADHHRMVCTDTDVLHHFVDTIWHTETPVVRTAPVPMRMLSGFVHDHGYRVVLTGEGADEVLGGYDIFKEAKIRYFWAKNPESSMRPLLLRRLYPYLELSRGSETAYLKHFFGIALEQPDNLLFSHLPRWTTTAKCKEFYSEEMRAVLRENVFESMTNAIPASYSYWHSFNRAQYLEAKVLMAGYLLCSQGDRMLMSNSVEGRFPFLDHRVIEFANSIHPKLKMKGLKEKYLLKKAMGAYLPTTIVKRTKQPYRGPGAGFLLGDSNPGYAEELLGKDALRRAGYFDPEKVTRLLEKVKRGNVIGEKDNMAVTSILSTQVWHHLFIEKFWNHFGTGGVNNEYHIKQYA